MKHYLYKIDRKRKLLLDKVSRQFDCKKIKKKLNHQNIFKSI